MNKLLLRTLLFTYCYFVKLFFPETFPSLPQKLKSKGENKTEDLKKQKKFEKEEKDFRKKFKVLHTRPVSWTKTKTKIKPRLKCVLIVFCSMERMNNFNLHCFLF